MDRLDPDTTALVLIDLQHGILAMNVAPHPADAILARAKTLIARFRAAGALVVPVRVGWAHDFADALRQPVDQPTPRPAAGLPADWSAFADGIVEPGDVVIEKHQWGAFTGTGLDLQLRRRHIRTIVLCGIATNFGVESTARHAWELGYEVVVVEDACTSFSAEMHRMAFQGVLPRISRVRATDDVGLEAA